MQDAGKLVVDGKAAFNIMGDWQDGYFSGTKAGGNLALKPKVDYNWAPVPGTVGVYDWLSDSFTLPKGAPPHRAAAVKWLGFLGSRKASGPVQPGQGLDPCQAGCELEAVRAVPEVGAPAVEDQQARRIACARCRRAGRLVQGRRHCARPLPT